jgi:hypothetical protein
MPGSAGCRTLNAELEDRVAARTTELEVAPQGRVANAVQAFTDFFGEFYERIVFELLKRKALRFDQSAIAFCVGTECQTHDFWRIEYR